MASAISVRSDTISRDVYSYEGEVVNSDPVWYEDFTVGDLPADRYQVVVLNGDGEIAFMDSVEVAAYRTYICRHCPFRPVAETPASTIDSIFDGERDRCAIHR